jgi:metallo-beta-lactamase family protein
MKLTFLGAAGEVTGSCYLVETGETTFLIDCGMFQGGRAAAYKNSHFGFDPRRIDFVLLSHAHIDHSGLLPRLVAQGFRGPVHATGPTCDLLGVMLPDSGHLQEREAEHGGRAALYTESDARKSLSRMQPADYDSPFSPGAGIRCTYRNAGHILGSAIVEVQLGRTKLVFSGDLGQPGHPLMRDPAAVSSADVLLVESTYGDRNHKSYTQTLDEIAYAVTDTIASRKGNVVAPAFAVGRTQDMLEILAQLRRENRIPEVQIFVDSPMALAATRVTLKYSRIADLGNVRFIETLEESRRIASVRSGAVIVSASGMCEGGRIKHHLQCNLARPECSILFAGFQAQGTLGRRIVDGAKTVRIYGEPCVVRARIFTVGGLSAHADQSALLAWLGRFRRPPRQTWVVHGEISAARALLGRIREWGWTAETASPRQTIALS